MFKDEFKAVVNGGVGKRRSLSPPARSSNPTYDAPYPPPSSASYYKGAPGYSGNGYSSGGPSAPPRGGSTRDYPPPRSREDDPGYRRL